MDAGLRYTASMSYMAAVDEVDAVQSRGRGAASSGTGATPRPPGPASPGARGDKFAAGAGRPCLSRPNEWNKSHSNKKKLFRKRLSHRFSGASGRFLFLRTGAAIYLTQLSTTDG